MNLPGYEKCSSCNLYKSVDGFYRSSFTKNGLRSHCIKCEYNYSKKYFSTPAGKKYRREKDRKYRESHKHLIAHRRKIRDKKEYTIKDNLIRRRNDLRWSLSRETDEGKIQHIKDLIILHEKELFRLGWKPRTPVFSDQ